MVVWGAVGFDCWSRGVGRDCYEMMRVHIGVSGAFEFIVIVFSLVNFGKVHASEELKVIDHALWRVEHFICTANK